MKSLQDEEPAIEKIRTWKRKAWMKRELERAANSLQQQDFTTPETATNELQLGEEGLFRKGRLCCYSGRSQSTRAKHRSSVDGQKLRKTAAGQVAAVEHVGERRRVQQVTGHQVVCSGERVGVEPRRVQQVAGHQVVCTGERVGVERRRVQQETGHQGVLGQARRRMEWWREQGSACKWASVKLPCA